MVASCPSEVSNGLWVATRCTRLRAIQHTLEDLFLVINQMSISEFSSYDRHLTFFFELTTASSCTNPVKCGRKTFITTESVYRLQDMESTKGKLQESKNMNEIVH